MSDRFKLNCWGVTDSVQEGGTGHGSTIVGVDGWSSQLEKCAIGEEVKAQAALRKENLLLRENG